MLFNLKGHRRLLHVYKHFRKSNLSKTFQDFNIMKMQIYHDMSHKLKGCFGLQKATDLMKIELMFFWNMYLFSASQGLIWCFRTEKKKSMGNFKEIELVFIIISFSYIVEKGLGKWLFVVG